MVSRLSTALCSFALVAGVASPSNAPAQPPNNDTLSDHPVVQARPYDASEFSARQARSVQRPGSATIEAYVGASIRLAELAEQGRSQLQNLQSEHERNALYRDLRARMLDVLRQYPGISVEEYQTISDMAEEDAEFRARLRNAVTSQRNGNQ